MGELRTTDQKVGSSNLFGRASLIEVIVPAIHYRAGLPAETHAEYDDLLSHASAVHRLHFVESTSEAQMAASKLMISMISELLAVWDQQPARAYGGTADVVAHARDPRVPSPDHLARWRISRLANPARAFQGPGEDLAQLRGRVERAAVGTRYG